MAEKTPREKLRETLDRNSLRVALWPKWQRQAACVQPVFGEPHRLEPDEMSPARAEIVRQARFQARIQSDVPHLQELWAQLAKMLDY